MLYKFQYNSSLDESDARLRAGVTNVLQNSFKVDILTNSEEIEYEDFLGISNFSSAQYSLEWRDTIRSLGRDKPYFIVAKKDGSIVGALPLYYYECKYGNLLTSIAWHTISGIICARNVDCRKVYAALLNYSLTLARELDCKALSINTNPFMEDKEHYSEGFKPDYAMENFVQYVCLNEVFDEKGNIVHPNYVKRGNLSRNLSKAKLQQVTISDEQSKANIDECFRIHEKRMKELHACPLPKGFFGSALHNLTLKERGKFLFAFYEKKMVAGCLFLSNERIMDAYMMSMDSEYNNLGTNFLLTYYMLKWAHENGIPLLNWMSSPRKGDGVYKWKEQWGSHERTFLYLTKILGDISEWKNMDCKELAEAYNLHYLVPFNLLKNTEKHTKFTSKDALTSFMQSLNCSR